MKNILNFIKKSPHRIHLESYLENFLPKLNGSILDIGSKNRRYDYLMKETPIAIDLNENKDKNVLMGDVQNLSFEDSSFDNVICLEVLEYVDEPKRALSEIFRVLKKDGILILSVPFMYKFHEDRLRYTKSFLQENTSAFSKVEIFNIGNSYSTILNIFYSKIKHIKFSPVRILLTIVYFPFAIFSPCRFMKKGQFNSGYFLVATK